MQNPSSRSERLRLDSNDEKKLFTKSPDVKMPMEDIKLKSPAHCDRFRPLFNLLPEEIIRMFFCWMDIPSLSVLIQTSKPEPSSVARLASDDVTWLSIVNRRFSIRSKKSSGMIGPPKPKLYGGLDWRAAYRSMSCSNRMPRNRIMPKKNVVFAKGGGGKLDPTKDATALALPGASGRKQGMDFVSLWVMVAHTENCNTRMFPNMQDDQPGRFIELRVCLQNIRSGFGSVDVDIARTSIQIIGTANVVDGLWTSNVVPSGPRRPRILFRSRENERDVRLRKYQTTRAYSGAAGNYAGNRGCSFKPCLESDPSDVHLSDGTPTNSNSFITTLEPFEYIIVSVHVPCAPEMRYETDFLSRALCAHVPACWNARSSSESSSSSTIKSLASAAFLPEKEMWNFYMELPGSCLTLSDRRRFD